MMEEKRLGFGMMRLPTQRTDRSQIDLDQVMKLADLFLSNGFSYFDTAYIYHGGKSEKAFRKCVAERYPRETFRIATKMPMLMIWDAQAQERIFQEQLQNLGVDFFDYYLVHNLNSSCYGRVKEFGTIDLLRRNRDRGVIRHLGFSCHDTPEFLDQVLTEYPDLEFVQLQINYLDWENAGVQSRKCYEVARKHGKPVIVMEPCKGGTLASLVPEAEALLRAAHPDWSIASWAIRFAASLEGVAMVLSGMNAEEQLLDNMRTLDAFQPLTVEDRSILLKARDIINRSIAISCTGCQYCVEGGRCPQNIAIPRYFSLYNAEKLDTNTVWSPQQDYYKNLVSQGFGRASQCIGCRRCEAACPQHLPVSDWMKTIAECFDGE